MLNGIFWVAFGSIIGWVAAILQNEANTNRLYIFISTGCVGGLLGGVIGLLIDPQTPHQTNTTDSMFAIFGATVFVFITGVVATYYRRSQESQND
jgi:uncharacterized membrane protein YeaQ/YmgE (transglycosylase-associated protein family)